MLRILASALVLTVLAVLVPSAPTEAADQCVKIQASAINVRADATSSSRCRGSLHQGTKTKITGCAGNWCKLKRTSSAYIAKQFKSHGNVVTTFRSSTKCSGTPVLSRCIN